MGSSRRVVWWTAASSAALAIAAYAVLTDGSSVLYQAIGLGSAGAVLLAVRRRWARPALPWVLVAVSLLLSWGGDAIWALYPVFTGADPPFPSLADVSYLAAYPVLLVATFLVRGRGTATSTGLLDSLIVAVPLTAVVWELAIAPTYASAGGGSAGALAVTVAYPVVDVLLIGTIARLVMAPGRMSVAARLLAAAVASQLVADIIYVEQSLAGTYVDGSLLDVCWLAAYALMGLAALHPSAALQPASALDDDLPTRRRMLVLGGSLFLAPAVLLWKDPHGHGLVALAWPVVTALVMLRMHGLARSLGILATSDSLTGLPNRASMSRHLERTVSEGMGGAVLFCDLDGFKLVNDGLGHGVGDRLLAEVGARLRRGMRAEDVVGRIGGDEFIVVCPGVRTVEGAREVAGRIRALLVEPFHLADAGDLAISVSVGAVVLDTDADAAALLELADAAMYRAKRSGRPEIELASAGAETTSLETLRTVAALRHDPGSEQLRLHYQPEFFVADGSVFGFEALVRWQHPERGLLLPGHFIEIAETSGEILRIGRWVLDEACRQIAAWSNGHDALPVSVNVSGRQLSDAGFPAEVIGALRRADVPPASLLLEITETAVVADIEMAVAAVATLKDIGVTIAIDDFGTGHSSLSQLRRLPVDFVKIDRSFTAVIDQTDRDRAIVAAIVDMARALGIQTIAEGVERASQLEILDAVGCDLAQGYLLGRPQGAEVAAELLAARPARRAS